MVNTYRGLMMWVVKTQHAKSYLEIGVLKGHTFIEAAGVVERAIGVDIKNQLPHEVGEFYEMSSDKFFETFQDKVDVIFIDGDHRFEQAKQDLLNALNHLNEFGTILMHDTDPYATSQEAVDGCADAYKIQDFVKRDLQDWDIVTFPIGDSGISVIREHKATRTMKRKSVADLRECPIV